MLYPNDPHSGMTVREYFAVIAMQGLLASDTGVDEQPRWSSEEIARLAVYQADALIARLKEYPSPMGDRPRRSALEEC